MKLRVVVGGSPLSGKQTQMKRFSSAQCLADKQQATTIKGSGAKMKQQKQKLKKKAQQQQQQCKQSEGLLLPEDPMVLARQRRPSVSNQGSVNVNQQGELLMTN